MPDYRTFDQMEEEYYREHPEAINSFLTIAFEEYAKDNDLGALLSALCLISRVKNLTATVEATEISNEEWQKTLSEDTNPRFEKVNAVIQALGYQLMPQPLAMDVVST